MFNCFLCKFHGQLPHQLLKHLDSCHPSETLKITGYTCAQPECGRYFHLKDSFRKHLISHLKQQPVSSTIGTEHNFTQRLSIVSPTRLEQQSGLNPYTEHNTCNNLLINTPPFDSIQFQVPESSINQITTLPKQFLLKLYSNPLIPLQAIQFVISGMRSFLKDDISKTIINTVKETSADNLLEEKLEHVLHGAFSGLETEFKRMQYFKNLGLYIAPEQVVIGQQLEDRKHRNTLSLKPVTCTEQIIPLRKVFQKFFSIPTVLSETLEYIKLLQVESSLMVNIMQGSSWRNRKARHGNKLYFPLILFFDDYETGNVLGSHASLHKLGAVYVSLGCLPPYYAAILECIFLALIFHSSDRIRFGNAVIFQPLINELKFLMNSGIEIDIPYIYSGKIFFEVAVVVGDNLGIHQLFGFVESFTSNYPCRFCCIRKNNLETMCYEDQSLLRTMENCSSILSQQWQGISDMKEKCVWLQLEDFNIFDRIAVDIMHDILEGSAVYVMTFLIQHYIITLKLFSLQVLNERMFSFDYGPDRSSKPVAISMEHLRQGQIKLSASEMLTFLRYFGLIVGDLIPTEEPSWDLYLTLRKILDIVLCRITSANQADLLHTLVSEHAMLYLKITKNNLKPKFHFQLHYAEMIKKFGPLRNLWCMRFEGKHRISKISARASYNRRNLTKSLAIKNQLQLMSLLDRSKLSELLIVGKKTPAHDIDKDDIFRYIPVDANSKSVSKVSWANVKGTKYYKNCVLTLSINEDGPKFGFIKKIFLVDSSIIIFKCEQIATLTFCNHLQCYEVSSSGRSWCYMLHATLASPIPNNYSISPDGRRYITLRDPL